jgi:hypothetical protein
VEEQPLRWRSGASISFRRTPPRSRLSPLQLFVQSIFTTCTSRFCYPSSRIQTQYPTLLVKPERALAVLLSLWVRGDVMSFSSTPQPGSAAYQPNVVPRKAIGRKPVGQGITTTCPATTNSTVLIPPHPTFGVADC